MWLWLFLIVVFALAVSERTYKDEMRDEEDDE